jgi:hypothetical protein
MVWLNEGDLEMMCMYVDLDDGFDSRGCCFLLFSISKASCVCIRGDTRVRSRVYITLVWYVAW